MADDKLDIAATYRSMSDTEKSTLIYALERARGTMLPELDISSVFNAMSQDKKLAFYFLVDLFLSSKGSVAQSGVKGMRWGFRKPGTRGSTPPSKRKKGDAAKEDKPEDKKKSIKDLSDNELQARITRLQREKQLAQLMTPEKKAQSVVAEVLKTSGRQIASQVITQVGTAYIKKALSVQLDTRLPAAYAVGKIPDKDKD